VLQKIPRSTSWKIVHLLRYRGLWVSNFSHISAPSGNRGAVWCTICFVRPLPQRVPSYIQIAHSTLPTQSFRSNNIKCTRKLENVRTPFPYDGRYKLLDSCKLNFLHFRTLYCYTCFENSTPSACRGSSGQKPQYGSMTLAYQRFTAMLLLIYGSLFLIGVYYCLRVFWGAVARMSELELEQIKNNKFLVKFGKSGSEIREMLV
jgi:hypothetical protein